MKFKIIIYLFLLSSTCFSQNLKEKYDDSYGIFILEFKIDEKGKASFIKVNQLQCKSCSEKLIHDVKKSTARSFKKSIKEYEKRYSPKVKDKELKFIIPIVFKISDLEE